MGDKGNERRTRGTGGSSNAGRTKPRSLKRVTLLSSIVLAAVFLGLLLPTPMAPILFIAAFCSFGLFLYVGLPLMTAAWLAAVIMKCVRVRSWTTLIFAIQAGIIILATGVVLFGLLGLGGARTHLQGLWVRMMVSADIRAIRAWAQTYQPTPDDQTVPDRDIAVPFPDWPPAIRELNPQYVLLDMKTRSVSLSYGSGFGHWGLGVPNGPRKGRHTMEAWLWGKDAYVFEHE